MKKRNQWMTKKLKRVKKLEDKGIVDFIQIQSHFFKEFNNWIDEMTDSRNESYCIYTQQDLIYLGILKNVCGIESMRQMNEKLNEEVCIETLSFLSGDSYLNELADSTTLNNYLERLSPACLSNLRRKRVTSLIRSKDFHKNRFWGNTG